MSDGSRLAIARRRGAASYSEVDSQYLEARQLRKSAGWVLLCALGVGAVISGDFFGWQYGLTAGGFGGLLVATAVIAVMYFCMVFSIAEMSAAMPHAGGFYGFTRSTFGPGTAFLNSTTDMVEYVVTPAVIVSGMAAYADLIVDLPNWMWWVGFYVLFVGINIWGTVTTFRVAVVVAGLSLTVLCVMYVGVIVTGAFDPALLTNVPVNEARTGASAFLPEGIYAHLGSTAVCHVVLPGHRTAAAGGRGSHDVRARHAQGTGGGHVRAVRPVDSDPGAQHRRWRRGRRGGVSRRSLFVALRAVFGSGIGAQVLAACALIGLVASFHSIIYAYGRVLFAASRSGYVPRRISRRRHGTPRHGRWSWAVWSALPSRCCSTGTAAVRLARRCSPWRCSEQPSPTHWSCGRTSCGGDVARACNARTDPRWGSWGVGLGWRCRWWHWRRRWPWSRTAPGCLPPPASSG